MQRMNKIAAQCNEIYPFRRFLSDQRKLDKVRRAWANPMSIYAPDSGSIAIINLNSRMSEMGEEISRKVVELKERIAQLNETDSPT